MSDNIIEFEDKDKEYDVAFRIISYSGEAKGQAVKAIENAKKWEFDKAEVLIKMSDQALVLAHNELFSITKEEARGNKAEVNLIIVHALDHLAIATSANDNAKLVLNLYKQIYELKFQEGRLNK